MKPNRTTALPQPALIFGLAGQIPLAALAVQVASGRPLDAAWTTPALQMLLLYGALMLSFLGGVQCGLAVATADRSDAWRRFGLPILPMLLAWGGVWAGRREGLITLAAGYVVWGAYEWWSTGLGEAPSWYGRLRLAFTVVAVAALGVAAKYGAF